MEKRFLQTDFWCDFKSRHGWKKLTVFCEGVDVNVLVRSFSLKFKKFSIAYVPMFPEFGDDADAGEVKEKLSLISETIRGKLPENTICIRYDPKIDYENVEKSRQFVDKFIHDNIKSRLTILKSLSNIQPPDTVLLPLSSTEDEILSQMKSKWRYNIRLAEKKGVAVEKYDWKSQEFEKVFDEFFKLFMQTSARDGVQFHDRSYYLDLLEKSAENEENPLVQLYVARHEGDYLAGIITLFCKSEAVYLYGASGNIKRNFMSAYLLQWTAIKDAKEYGCPVYDFYGCPPTDDEKHPMHGLFLFKTGFGGKLVHRPGSFDAVLRPCDYRLYVIAEKARAWYYKVFKKRLAGR